MIGIESLETVHVRRCGKDTLVYWLELHQQGSELPVVLNASVPIQSDPMNNGHERLKTVISVLGGWKIRDAQRM